MEKITINIDDKQEFLLESDEKGLFNITRYGATHADDENPYKKLESIEVDQLSDLDGRLKELTRLMLATQDQDIQIEFVNCEMFVNRDSINSGDPQDEEHTTDLNMMIAPVFAYAWKQTGDIKYKEFAYELWLRAYENASLYIPKVFNQNIWWYEDFINWLEVK